MIDLIKKSVMAGIGAAMVTKEKVEEALGDFVRQGKVSAADAAIMAEKIAEQGRREFDELGSRLSAKVKEFNAKADEKTQARLTALEQRVRVLEEKLTPPSSRAGEP
jgi:polyhydroxyalkanoate synthesis regulator phasin